ncbi:hypothetical protein RvY_05605 [Ramazzottius varieornatus]|uniref:Uncharacterized protein n=1 Tax=Ramazzottius varieornatus TaxID=947166 RepID=A0A1D1UVM6_RAMVA|nr:hypothetical protein RvY_05605 [Ramazzottius varieornatus]
MAQQRSKNNIPEAATHVLINALHTDGDIHMHTTLHRVNVMGCQEERFAHQQPMDHSPTPFGRSLGITMGKRSYGEQSVSSDGMPTKRSRLYRSLWRN